MGHNVKEAKERGLVTWMKDTLLEEVPSATVRSLRPWPWVSGAGWETGTSSSQRFHCSFWNLLPSGATLLPLALPTAACCPPASQSSLGKTSPSLGLQVTERQTMTGSERPL